MLTKAVATAAHAAGLIVLIRGIYGKVLRPQAGVQLGRCEIDGANR